jgi:hypothetical protein
VLKKVLGVLCSILKKTRDPERGKEREGREGETKRDDGFTNVFQS